MASAGIISFKLIINLRRRIQFLLQTVCPHQGRRTVHLIEIKYLLRDIDITVIIVQFLGY